MPDDESIATQSMVAMLMVKRVHDHILSSLCSKYELSPIDIDILYFLSKNPELNTATSIIENRHFTKSHVSNALKHLEKAGFINKFFDGCNHKTIYLSLTHKALLALDEIEKAFQEFSNVLTQNIPAASINIAHSVLSQMIGNAVNYGKNLKT